VNSGSANALRDGQIVERYLKGNITLRQLGAEHGISCERVRQVLDTAGINSRRIRTIRRQVRAQQAQERRCVKRFGVDTATHGGIRDGDAALRREGVTLGVIRCFERDKRRAKQQGVAWELDLQQYAWLWSDFGRFDRGTIAKPEYELGRLDESAPFSYDNAVFDTICPRKPEEIVKRKYTGLPTGVRRVGKRYVAVSRIGGGYRRFGPYESAAEAAASYASVGNEGRGSNTPPSEWAFV